MFTYMQNIISPSPLRQPSVSISRYMTGTISEKSRMYRPASAEPYSAMPSPSPTASISAAQSMENVRPYRRRAADVSRVPSAPERTCCAVSFGTISSAAASITHDGNSTTGSAIPCTTP